MPMNPKVNEECERRMKADEEAREARWETERYYRDCQTIIHEEREAKRRAELMEQCKQKAKKNIELEKRKQAHSNKKETPEEYKARKELQTQKVVKKETPEEYKARKELQAQRALKK
jgi:hypothetical protein